VVAAVAIALAMTLALAACNTQRPPSSVVGTVAPAPTTSSSVDLPASFGPPPSESPDESTPLTLQPALLGVLPATIDETPVQEDGDVAAEALQDPAMPRIASGLDAAVAVDTATGNLVTAWVVQLKPGAFGDEAYRQWRDSYDEGACNAAGGIVGRAQATLGGRETYVTSCVAALRTYHVWLRDQDLLISASSIGDGRYGEKLMSTLRVSGPVTATPEASQ
jgi:hypothetical protein